MNEVVTKEREEAKISNRAAVIESMAEHIPYLRRYAIGLTQSRADGDDLVQAALEKAIVKVEAFQPGTNLRGWLMTILHHTFIDAYRAKRNRGEFNSSHEILAKGLYSPSNQFIVAQMTDVEAALARLPPAQRVTLLLVALEDMPYNSVARITNVPVGTVRSRLSRARSSMMKMVSGKYIHEAIPPHEEAV